MIAWHLQTGGRRLVIAYAASNIAEGPTAGKAGMEHKQLHQTAKMREISSF